MHLARNDHVLQHASLQRDAVHLHNLVAVAQVALRGDRAAWLHLDNDVVERQPDAKAVLLSQKVDGQLEHLLRRPWRLLAAA